MSYEVIALDMDGTLTNSQKVITETTRKALIKIQESGKRVVICTGRPEYSVLPFAKELEMDRHSGFIITFNGSRILNVETEEVVYNLPFDQELLIPICEMVRKYPDTDILSYFGPNLLSGIQPNQYSEHESWSNQMPILHAKDFPNAEKYAPLNCLFAGGEPEVLFQLQKDIEETFGDQLYLYRSEPFFLEIMPPGVDKAFALEKLMEHLNLSVESLICVGDGYNDVSMMKYAGLGVAMDNAHPGVKEHADYITKSNDEDGIVDVLEKFMK